MYTTTEQSHDNIACINIMISICTYPALYRQQLVQYPYLNINDGKIEYFQLFILLIISIIDTLNEHSDFLLPKKYFLPTNDNHNNKYHKCLFSWFMSNSHTLAYTYMSERRTHFADMRRVCLTLFRIMTNIVFITIISVNGVIFFFSFHSFAREFLYDECHHLFVCLDYYYDYFSAR